MTPDRWTDAALDDVLRGVPVPENLAARLRPSTVFDDAAIDRMLTDVAVPPALAVRPAASPPARMPRSARDRPAAGVRGVRWLRAALGDGALLALAAAILGVAVLRTRPADDVAPPRARPSIPAPTGFAGRADDRAEPSRSPGQAAAPSGDRVASAPPGGAVGGLPGGSASTDDELPARRPVPEVRGAPVPLGAPPRRTGAGRGAAPFTGMRVVADAWDGAGGTVRRPLPRTRGFDVAFAMAHGEHPFVDPALAPSLAADRPPLGVATDSFDRVWPLPAGRQRRVEMEAMRVEHVVAALPAAPRGESGGGPRLGLSAVRSLRAVRPGYLVEVCVDLPAADDQAGDVHGADEALLVLDHSAAPSALPLWVAACRGLGVAAAGMSPDDRLTVVVAEPRPRLAAIRAGAAEIARLAAELEAEPPFGVADLDAAVTLAEETMARAGAAARLVVVAHGAHAERCSGPGRAALLRWRQTSARGSAGAGGPVFLLISGVPEGDVADQLADVPGWAVSDPTTVRRRVADAVFARPAAVARGVQLEVRFDPESIAAFRLVGHRQEVPESLAAGGGSAAVVRTIDLHGGEAIRAVYEVVPRRGVTTRIPGIAAFLTFVDQAGVARRLTADGVPIDGVDGALPSPRGCELLLAVGVSEVAGRSVHVAPARSVVDQLRTVAAAWGRRGDVTAVGATLVGLLDDLTEGPAAGR